MIEKDILKFHQEVGEIKNVLMTADSPKILDDHEKFTIATKIDIAVSRFIRLVERIKEKKDD
jgi:hypothetical protein